MLIRLTKKFFPAGARIVEGGCGMASKVFRLYEKGYDIYGIDNAEDTIKTVKKYWPHLKLETGDVKNLPYENGFFDGYMSFGVIEHFFAGFDEVLREMYRVLKKDGYLFLSFPMMSPLRKLKAKLGKYPVLRETQVDEDKFYQYALDPKAVKIKFEKSGFRLVRFGGSGTLKELTDEISTTNPVIKFLYRTFPRITLIFGVLLDLVMRGKTGHMATMVLKKV